MVLHVNYKQFRYIALAPFVVISLLLIAAFLLVSGTPAKALLLGALVFHTLCCVGDFGLCAYLYRLPPPPATQLRRCRSKRHLFLQPSPVWNRKTRNFCRNYPTQPILFSCTL